MGKHRETLVAGYLWESACQHAFEHAAYML